MNFYFYFVAKFQRPLSSGGGGGGKALLAWSLSEELFLRLPLRTIRIYFTKTYKVLVGMMLLNCTKHKILTVFADFLTKI